MAYNDVGEFRQWARKQIDIDEAFASSALEAAYTLINRVTARVFDVAAASATARVFEADRLRDCARSLLIDDCTEITSIVGAATETASNYRAIASGGNKFGLTWPYDTVRHLTRWVGEAQWGYFTVTAKWDWPATPIAIKEAERILAKDIASNRDVRNGLIDFGDGAVAGMRRNPFVVDTCEAFRGNRSWGVA
jgi:hypothetical protein